MNFLNFVKKIKINSDLKNIIYILIIFLVLFNVFLFRLGNAFIDCGREAYIPSQILQGQVLYKDIFNIYGPLSYLLNTLLFYIFGENLNVLYFAGGFASAITLIFCYLLARNFVNRPLSFAYVFFVMIACVFNFSMYNFIFPYSYSMVYSSIFLVGATFFATSYLKNKKESYIILSFLLAGGALATKIEFLFLPAVFSGILIFQKKSFYTWIKCFIALIIFPLLCFLILFVQGLDLSSFLESIKTISAIKNTETLKYFYTNILATYYSKTNLIVVLFSYLSFMLFFVIFTALFYLLHRLKGFINSKRLIFIFEISIFWILFCNIWQLSQDNVFFTGFLYKFCFSWLPIFLTIFVLISLFSFPRMNKSLFLLVIISIFSALRGYFSLNLIMYGTSMLILPLLSLLVILYKNKNFLKKLNIARNSFNRLIFYFFIMLGALHFLNSAYSAYDKNLAPIETKKGKLIVSKEKASRINNIVEWLETKSLPQDEVLILPEGHLTLFLSERSTNNNLHSLIPLYVEAFGEDKIINNLKKDPAKYIIILNLDLRVFGKSFFCKDYAEQICTYINNDYTLEKLDSDNFYKIYKLKSAE